MKHITLLILISISFLTGCCHKHTHPIKSGYLDVDQGKIYYETYGKGEPIIVLHGGGGGLSHDYLMPQMLELATRYQVTFYDQRGGGKSTNTIYDKKYISDEQFIEDLDALRKSLGHEKVTLLGHSYGGRLSMEYAIKYPEHVKSMILADTSAATLQGNKDFFDEFNKRTEHLNHTFATLRESPKFAAMDLDIMHEFFRTTFSEYFYDKTKANQLTLRLTKDSVQGFWKTQNIMMADYATKKFDLRPSLAKLTIPTLIIHGDHDIIPLSTPQEIHAVMPTSKLVIIKDCDHFPFVEKPKEFFDAIDEFLH